MPSTFSSLKFELIGSGEQSNTWGNTTNTNIGTAIEQAITGLSNPVFLTDADLTLTLTDLAGPSLQVARALVLNVTSAGSLTATRELVVPTIQKQYIVQNNTTGGQSITVKTASGTGITVPNGARMHLYVNGVNVVNAISYFSALTLGAALPVTSGGTGVTNPSLVQGTGITVSGTWPNQTISSSATGDVVGPASATDSALVAFDGTTGKLIKQAATVSVAQGGTGLTTATAYGVVFAGTTSTGAFQASAGPGTATHVLTSNGPGALPTFQALPAASNLTGAVTSIGTTTSLGSFSSANLAGALTDETGSGAAVFANSPTLVTPNLGTPSVLVGTNITGTASGLTAGTVTTNANLTGAITSTGNATSLGSFSSANLAAALTDETGTGANVFANSPTLVTPVLGTPTSGNLDNCTADGTNKVGYRNVPPSGAKTSSYTLVAADVGKFVELGTGGSVVVPSGVFAAGDVVSIFNNTSGTIACTCSAITDVYKAGTDADISSFSITTRGVANILFITTTRAVVTGNLA
jgi:hypothetical protein